MVRKAASRRTRRTVSRSSPKLHTVAGGGTRSEKAPPFHLVPRELFRRVAARFGLGADKHGAWNWLKSCSTEADAYIWCAEAYNHMVEHALKLAVNDSELAVGTFSAEDETDDHLGAIGWTVAVIAYCEARFGKRWNQFTRPSA